MCFIRSVPDWSQQGPSENILQNDLDHDLQNDTVDNLTRVFIRTHGHSFLVLEDL